MYQLDNQLSAGNLVSNLYTLAPCASLSHGCLLAADIRGPVTCRDFANQPKVKLNCNVLENQWNPGTRSQIKHR